ncbi:cytochrome C [Arcobacter sp. FWKO B]|nr:cytochrome C [Arcobacter sp. FWKO B]
MFEGNCLACHNIKTELSAPSVIEFKSAYMDLFPKKTDFIDFMSMWVYEPDEHTAFMPDAIRRYGLMPELGYDLEMLRDIAEYIYDTDFSNQ